MDKVTKQLQAVGAIAKRYIVVVVLVIFGAMYGFLILTSSKQAENEPSDAQISEKLQATPRPKIDKEVADKLQELEEKNIEIKSIFDDARNNPFSE